MYATVRGKKTFFATAISADGSLVACGGDTWDIQVHDVQTGDLLQTFTGHEGRITELAFHPSRKLLASTGPDGTVRLWRIDTGKHAMTLRGGRFNVFGLGFSRDGKLLAAAGENESTITIWSVDSGNEVLKIKQRVIDLTFDDDGDRLIALGMIDGVARSWSTATGNEILSFRAHRARMSHVAGCVALSHNGRTLATGGADRKAKLWDHATGKELNFWQYPDTVMGIGFAPNDRFLAVGCWDGRLVLEQIGGRRPSIVLKEGGNSVTSLAFSQDGSKLVVSCGNTVEFWRISAQLFQQDK